MNKQQLDTLIVEHKATDYKVVDAQYEQLFGTDWFKSRPQKIQNAYRKYPPWHFYTSANGKVERRIYGFCEMEDGEVRAHAVTAMFVVNNDLIDGWELGDIKEVPHYNDDQILHISMTPTPELFLHHKGWLSFAMSNNSKDEILVV